MEYVENYFQSGVEDPTQNIRRTNLPPIYFQHAGTCGPLLSLPNNLPIIIHEEAFHIPTLPSRKLRTLRSSMACRELVT